MLFIYSGILFNHKGGNPVIFNKINGTKGDYEKWNSQAEEDKYSMISLTCRS
jgi:hypothetical protein